MHSLESINNVQAINEGVAMYNITFYCYVYRHEVLDFMYTNAAVSNNYDFFESFLQDFPIVFHYSCPILPPLYITSPTFEIFYVGSSLVHWPRIYFLSFKTSFVWLTLHV